MASPITNAYNATEARARLSVERVYLFRPRSEWTYSHHAATPSSMAAFMRSGQTAASMRTIRDSASCFRRRQILPSGLSPCRSWIHGKANTPS